LRRLLYRSIAPQSCCELPARQLGCLDCADIHSQATQPFPRKARRARLAEAVQPIEQIGTFRRARAWALTREPRSRDFADVTLRDQGCQRSCVLAHTSALTFNDQPRQPGMNREAKHLSARIGQPALAVQ